MNPFQNMLQRRIQASSRGPVASAEFRRIEALPKRENMPLVDISRCLFSEKRSGKYQDLLPSQLAALGELEFCSAGFVGLYGVGCVRGTTRIQTPQGPVCIKDLKEGTAVLSVGSDGWQWASCNAPYVKGRERLLAIQTSHGEFVAHGRHLVALADGTWKHAEDLTCSDLVLSYSLLQRDSSSELSPLEFAQDVHHSRQTHASFQECCSFCSRQCDLQPRAATGDDPQLVQKPHDAEVRTPCGEQVPCSQGAGALEHSRLGQSHSHQPSLDCAVRKGDPVDGVESCSSLKYVQLGGASNQASPQFQKRSECRPLDVGPLFRFSSCLTAYHARVSDVKQLKETEEFWDIEIPETGNYCAEGFVHHNSGKTGISILAGAVSGCQKVLLVVPPALRQRTLDEIEEYRKAWIISDITVLSWSDLSQAKNKDLLDELGPFDMIVFDEAHNLKNRKSARGGRVARHLKKNSETRVVALSGTMTRKSVSDVAWIFEAALGEGSPLPRTFSDQEDWAASTDDKPLVRYKPGVLTRFMQPGETVREAVWRRVAETPGVLRASVAEEDLPSLVISNIQAKAPADILGALAHLNKEWELPGGMQLSDPMAVQRAAKQLSLGFYYEPVWPEEILQDVRQEWTAARKEWAAFVRKFSKYQAHDSEALVKAACRRGELDDELLLRWEEAQALTFGPTKRANFLKGFYDLSWKVGEWLSSEKTGIVWCDSIAVGERLAKEHTDQGVVYFGAGSTEKDVLKANKAICSIRVCGTGMNLQSKFSSNLVIEPPSSGVDWEQVCGRTHRLGQPEDEVTFDVLTWTEPLRTAWDSAVTNADYLKTASGSMQKLLLATKTGF
jgi:hypothetical protein